MGDILFDIGNRFILHSAIRSALLYARGSMILAPISATVSVAVGYGLLMVSKNSKKAQQFLHILSWLFCIIPACLIFKILGEHGLYMVIQRSVGRFIFCGILGWRIPYRIGKIDKNRLIGIIFLTMARNIMIEMLTGVLGFSYLIKRIATMGYVFQTAPAPIVSIYVVSTVILGVIIIISLCVLGKYFLYPTDKKKIFKDML